MNTLGEKLKAARIEKKLSQNEVSEKLLVSRQTISKWENNVCLPDLDNFQKICDLYGLRSDDLLNSKSETMNTQKERPEMDSLLFLIPFFFLFVVIQKEKAMFQLSSRGKILLLFNILFTLFLAYFIFCAIPKTTIIRF